MRIRDIEEVVNTIFSGSVRGILALTLYENLKIININQKPITGESM